MSTARSPPARPHLGIRPSNHFSSLDWGEDDAWDSTSDSESPRQSSAPRPVPAPVQNTSSSTSTLAFSYTHVSAPNPSSYPPRNEPPHPPKTGWTIVRTTQSDDVEQSNQDDSYDNIAANDVQPDTDVDGDMILGELDIDTSIVDPTAVTHAKSKEPKSSIRQDVDDVVNDPLHGIHYRHPTASPRKATKKLMREKSIKSNRRHKFVECLSNQDVNITELRKLSWAGIPDDLRPMAWQLLLGYLPLPTPLRITTLARKRQEYQSLVEVAFARDREGLDQQIWHQIEIDVPRTRPGVRLWMHAATQRSLERVLYVWAIRHPASGYVQGINDLVTPFFQVFLSSYIDSNPEDFDPALLPKHVLDAVEADSFWCLSRLLDGIQDNYIFAQPGIQRSVRRMAELVARIDAPLAAHLEGQNVEFMQFAFRWMNCLLMREISVQNTIRMWDTYLAEGPDAFSQFHLYVCSAFLVKWSDKLRQMDFQGIIMFLQSLPTQGWGDHEIEMLLSEAFVLNSIWHNAQSHFTGK
ncbi:RabGAP/TBC [Hymenopellis radicata]|nr:RabGAP/TBC [Hymenopellis radicata]